MLFHGFKYAIHAYNAQVHISIQLSNLNFRVHLIAAQIQHGETKAVRHHREEAKKENNCTQKEHL